jgi:pectate lyase
MVANYYKSGPGTTKGDSRHRIVAPSSRDEAADYGKWYVAENFLVGDDAVTADNWNGGVQPQHGDKYLSELKLDEPWEAMPIRQQTAEEAYEAVLAQVGASLPKRDAVDRRIVEEVRAGAATYAGGSYATDQDLVDPEAKSGIIDSPLDVGGWPELKSLPAPTDGDGDGMPDDWENQYGLDANNAADGLKDGDNDGYTNVEEYLNGTDPTAFVDYTEPKNNVNTLR